MPTTTTTTKKATRVRIPRQRSKVVTGVDEKEIEKAHNTLAALYKQIADSKHLITEVEPNLQAMLRSARMDEFSNKNGTSARKVTQGRASTFIDPREFEAEVESEEFYDSIKVQVTAAKEVLSGKTFKRIAQVTPGKPGAEKLVFSLPKVK